MEGILVAMATRLQIIHFDSFWGLPGFQNDDDDEKSSPKANAEATRYFGTVGFSPSTITTL
jgi:hypothetical protein